MNRTAWCISLLVCAGCAREASLPTLEEDRSVRVPARVEEERVTLGARLRDLPAAVDGALIHEVLEGGPADRAGLLTGDWIQAVDGVPVADVMAYKTALTTRSPGEDVALSIRRGAETFTAVIRLADTVEVYKAACDQGNPLGCLLLGDYQRTTGNDEATQLLAVMLYEKACDAGLGEGCAEAGMSYQHAIGVEESLTRAASYHQQACDLNSGIGCYNLGTAYEGGAGVEKDADLAAQGYARGCAAGYGLACERAAQLRER